MRSSCSAELMAPTSVFLSSGSPTRSRRMRSHSLAVTSSATDSWMSSREPAQQTWPWLKKIPCTMPSTAWSMAASSKTMLADLPPSSSVRPTPRPASAAWMSLPTAVEPVKATLSTSERTSAAPATPSPGMMFATPGGQLGLLEDLGQQQRGQRRRLGRLEDRGVAARERGRELPGRHEQREVPRHDLPDDAVGLVLAPRDAVAQLVGPAGVVEEVRGGQRDVDVARLADRLAAVDRLDDGQLARALLDQARDAEEVLRALAPGQLRPLGLRGARGVHGGGDVGLAGEGDLGHGLLGGRVDRRHAAPVAGVDELAADEQAVGVAQADVVGGLGRGRVVPGDARARGVGGSHAGVHSFEKSSERP